jgi:UDP-glucuronate decarboxylase
MVRILVTGGTGFIGSHLCDKLINMGFYVICLDNNSTGNVSNVKHLIDNPNFELIIFDIILMVNLNVDYIYHLACPASPKAYQKDPIKTLDTNYIGTKNMCELARLNNATILFTSTSEIYGDPHISPQVESYWGNVNPIGIRSCYDEGKRIGETLLMEYHRCYNVNIRIARIFNTYGPNMDKDDGRVVSNIINQCLSNKDITIYGSGNQTRSFCYVDDTVNGLIKLMNNDKTIGPVNIGNDNEITILQLSQIILKLFKNCSSKLVYNDLPQDDPTRRRPDLTLAKKYLEWEPCISLEDGLKKTIHYFSNIDTILFENIFEECSKSM